ncbi:MAG: NUDIX hydrolase [Ktedonobacterales bacterium]
MTMINLPIGDGIFNYRVAGVAIADGCVLLQCADFEDFWALPGGRVEFGESSAQALRRELREELSWGDDMRVGPLLWIVENFYTYQGQPTHEIGIYYLMAPDDPAPLADKTLTYPCHEPDSQLFFRWFPLATLEETTIKPAFLYAALRNPPTTTRHIILHERP